MSHDDPKRLYPIIYVRGYAGSQDEVEETVSTPYMGFNLGATKLRQRWNGDIVRHVFESPLVRLMKDHGYRDVFAGGQELRDSPLPPTSVIIYRYYESASRDLGTGERLEIEDYAKGLDELITQVRQQVCAFTGERSRDFRLYLVAHSMGGLICRAFLQNPKLGTAANRRAVDKVYTYATPHGGIDVRVLGNMPGLFTFNNADNFNHKRMRKFLGLTARQDVRSLNKQFDANRFFSLVGTDAKDYDAAGGWSSRMVGPLSDGLVQIKNAAAEGSPRAFVHRSHSGAYGIVNSEEGYQNLKRFLFGNVRVDAVLKVEALDLPAEVQKALDDRKKVRASYHFEVDVRPRGGTYSLHRRVASENSAIFRSWDDLFPDAQASARDPYLFSVYLTKRARTKRGDGPLVFAVDLRVRVPDYEIAGALFFENHIEGSYLYSRTLAIAAVPPANDRAKWTVRYGFNPMARNPTPLEAEMDNSKRAKADGLLFRIPIDRTQRPGMVATLELTARDWG